MTWTQSFGNEINGTQISQGVTDFITTTDNEGNEVLWLSAGRHSDNGAKIWQKQVDEDQWRLVANPTALPYWYCLCLEKFGGNRYGGMGCYAHTGDWKSDHGDVWRLALSETDDLEGDRCET